MVRRDFLGSVIGFFVTSGLPFVAKATIDRVLEPDKDKFFRSPDLSKYQFVVCTDSGDVEGPPVKTIQVSDSISTISGRVLPSKIVWSTDDFAITTTCVIQGIRLVNPSNQISEMVPFFNSPACVYGDTLKITYSLDSMPDRGQLHTIPLKLRDYVA